MCGAMESTGLKEGKCKKSDALLSTVRRKDGIWSDGAHCAQPDLCTGRPFAHADGAVFVADETPGSALWNTVLVLAGRALGHAWSSIGAFMDTYAMLLWGALGLLGAVFWMWRR